MFETDLAKIRQGMTTLLDTLDESIRADVFIALQDGRRLFDENVHAGVWALLPYYVAKSVNRDCNPIHVAIASECLAAALNVMDNVIDQDKSLTLEKLGDERAILVSGVLFMIAQKALIDNGLWEISRLFTDAALTGLGGQHKDIVDEKKPIEAIDIDYCIQVAATKAGSFFATACKLGAIYGGANETICKQFQQVGLNMGIAAMLDNDAHGLKEAVDGGENTDLLRQKKTLPVILANQERAQTTDENVDPWKLGYTAAWAVSLLYRDRGKEILDELAQTVPVVEELYVLLGLRVEHIRFL